MAAKNVRNQKEAGGNRKKSAQEYTGVDKSDIKSWKSVLNWNRFYFSFIAINQTLREGFKKIKKNNYGIFHISV